MSLLLIRVIILKCLRDIACVYRAKDSRTSGHDHGGERMTRAWEREKYEKIHYILSNWWTLGGKKLKIYLLSKLDLQKVKNYEWREKKRVLSSNSFNIIKKLRVATSFDIIVVLVALTLTLDIDSISTSRTEKNFQHFFHSLFFRKMWTFLYMKFRQHGRHEARIFFFSLL